MTFDQVLRPGVDGRSPNEAAVLAVLRAFRFGQYQACINAALPMLSSGVLTPEVGQALVISAQRTGVDVSVLSERLLPGLAERPWQQLLLRLTLGEVTFDEVLAAAADDNARCQALFYWGARCFTVGDIGGARRALDRCLSSEGDCLERRAFAELERERLPKSNEESAGFNRSRQVTELLARASGLWAHQSKADQAIYLCRCAYELSERCEPDIRLAVLQSLGSLLTENGDPTTGLSIFQQQHELAAQTYGEKSVEAAAGASNLALALNRLELHSKAQPFYAFALRIYATQLGEGDPRTIATVGNIALNHRKQQRFTEARDWYLKWHQMLDQLHGDRSPEGLRALRHLLDMFIEVGAHDDAANLAALIKQLERGRVEEP